MFTAGAMLQSPPSAVGARAPAVSQGTRMPREQTAARRKTKDFAQDVCEIKEVKGEPMMTAQRPDRRALWRELRAMNVATHSGGMYHSHIADQLSSADPFSM